MISFIIPTLNEELHINECLSRITLGCRSNDIDFEIIVVDNGSTDITRDTAKKYTSSIYYLPKFTIAALRNIGVHREKANIFAFIDADVYLEPEWFITLKRQIERQEDLFCTGYRYGVAKDAGWIADNWFANLKPSGYLSGGNLIISRATFNKAGGFDESLITGEDVDFCKRVESTGVTIDFNEGYQTIHDFPTTLKGFFIREIWHGKSDTVSHIAILGYLYLLSVVSIFAVAFISPVVSGLMLLTFLVGNLALTVLRFPHVGIKTVLINSGLNMVYFVARGMSVFKR